MFLRATTLVATRSSSRRPLASLLLAMTGYGLTFWAWTLIGPVGWASQWNLDIGDTQLTLLAAVAVVVGSLGRIPVGILTDRYGAHVVLCVTSVTAALAVLALAAIDSGPVVVVLAVALGVAGTTFASGSALVIRAYPPARRGMALSVYGAGMGIASTAAVLSGQFLVVNHRVELPVLAMALVAYGVLTAALIRDRPDRRTRPGYHWRIGLDVLKLPATRYLSAAYAIAFGGIVALGLYLPAALRHVYHLDGGRPLLAAAACLTTAAASRPVGGWLCQRHDPVPVLRVCFAASAAFGLLLAFQPPLVTTAIPALAAFAASLGLASGAVQAAIGATVPPERAGVITGTIGAVGGLAGLVPPFLLSATHGLNGSYGIGLTVLAGASLSGAVYLRRHGRWIAAAVAFPAAIGPRHTATTIATLPSADSTRAAETIAPLITMATRQEIVIISTVPERAVREYDGYPLVTALRLHLPRHRIVAVVVGADPHPHETALIADLIDDGAIPVVLTTASSPTPAALHLADVLHADHVLNISYDRIDGTRIQRQPTPAVPSTVTERHSVSA